MAFKCYKCREAKDSVCPCTVTLVGSMRVQQTVNVPSPLSPGRMMAQETQKDLPLPFQTTMFLCIDCNATRLAREVQQGPMGCTEAQEWLKPSHDERQNVLPLTARRGKDSE